jgi:hypothetical protein
MLLCGRMPSRGLQAEALLLPRREQWLGIRTGLGRCRCLQIFRCACVPILKTQNLACRSKPFLPRILPRGFERSGTGSREKIGTGSPGTTTTHALSIEFFSGPCLCRHFFTASSPRTRSRPSARRLAPPQGSIRQPCDPDGDPDRAEFRDCPRSPIEINNIHPKTRGTLGGPC